AKDKPVTRKAARRGPKWNRARSVGCKGLGPLALPKTIGAIGRNTKLRSYTEMELGDNFTLE
ncbi:MAG: hypothetical protein WCC59_18690, partial [Terriglobales bacterium]